MPGIIALCPTPQADGTHVDLSMGSLDDYGPPIWFKQRCVKPLRWIQAEKDYFRVARRPFGSPICLDE